MKKYIRLVVMMVVFVILLSCTRTLNRTYEIYNFTKLDFTKYTEKGFLFSPYQYNGDYEAIGIINYKFVPSAEFVESKEEFELMYEKGNRIGDKKDSYKMFWLENSYNLYDLLDSIYYWSTSKGANAIVDLKLNVTSEYFGYGYINPITIKGVEITGFAIKRK